MSNLIYLMLAVGGSIVGSLVIWLRNRKPTSVESGIDEFNRGLRALDPHSAPPIPRGGATTGGSRRAGRVDSGQAS